MSATNKADYHYVPLLGSEKNQNCLQVVFIEIQGPTPKSNSGKEKRVGERRGQDYSSIATIPVLTMIISLVRLMTITIEIFSISVPKEEDFSSYFKRREGVSSWSCTWTMTQTSLIVWIWYALCVTLCTVSPTIKKHAGYVTSTCELVLLHQLIAPQR